MTAISPDAVACIPSAPRWYLTSPVPPSGVPTTAWIVRSPSNSRRISSYRWPDRVREHAQAPAVGHTDHDLVGAALGGELERLVEHRHHHVEALGGEQLLPEERAAQVGLERLRPRQALEQEPLLGDARAACGSGRTRSRGGASAAPRARKCARSRTRSCRSRSRRARGAHRRACHPARKGRAPRRGCAPGARGSTGAPRARARATGLRPARCRADRAGPPGARAGDRRRRAWWRRRPPGSARRRAEPALRPAAAPVRGPPGRAAPRVLRRGGRCRPPSASRAGARDRGAWRRSRCRRSRTAAAIPRARRTGSRGTPRAAPSRTPR